MLIVAPLLKKFYLHVNRTFSITFTRARDSLHNPYRGLILENIFYVFLQGNVIQVRLLTLPCPCACVCQSVLL